MPGNILIATIVIFYGSLVNLMAKPAPSGDYGVGYGFVWILLVSGFFISTGLLAWNLNQKHCFDWAPAFFLRYRNWLVFLGWIAFALATIWSLEYKSKWHEGEFPQFMHWFALSRAYLWLPLLILIPALYLLNTHRQVGFAPDWVKIPMQIGFIVSVLIGLGILYGFAKSSVQQQAALVQSTKNIYSPESWSFNNSMEYINNYNEKMIQGLLIYTHREKDERLRNAAVAKIKLYEHWETELIQILQQGDLNDMYWVYAFLDGNKIEHPKDFILPINNSLTLLVSGVQESLNDPYRLNLGYINIEAMCRVLDTQFKDSAAVFLPNILKLQKTLEITPPERKSKKDKQWFDASLSDSRIAVKNWLESNQ